MTAAGIHHCQAVILAEGLLIDNLHLRFLCIHKVDVQNVPCRTGQLIHQAAGFPEIGVFCRLGNQGEINGRKTVVMKQLAAGRGDEN